MSFNDLQQKAISEAAIIAAHANLAKLSLFAKSYSELAGRPGASVAVPVYDLSAAGDFVAGSNDYGSGSNEVGGELITLNKHLVKSVSITDQQLAETGINWAKDTATALADRLTRDVNEYVFGLINSTNCPLSVSNALSSKNLIAELYKAATETSGTIGTATVTADIPVDRAIVALNPTNFAKVLGQLDANIYGGTEAIRLGFIPGLYGFKAFVCTTNLPAGTNGAIIMDGAVGIASRYLAPMTPGAYPEAWAATADDGFTLGFRRFSDLNTGADKFAADVLVGAKVLQPAKVVRIG